ncbi:MAG: hypothetical protein AB7U98_09635 [Candidatus Nitrosocosmicus sp.]
MTQYNFTNQEDSDNEFHKSNGEQNTEFSNPVERKTKGFEIAVTKFNETSNCIKLGLEGCRHLNQGGY